MSSNLYRTIKKRNWVGEGKLVTSEVVAYAIALGAVILAVITIYIMRRRGKDEPQEPAEQVPEVAPVLPLTGERTVTQIDAQKSKKELRLLDVDRGILSYGIRHLYEAQAEGKITEEERERLAKEYTQKMQSIKNSISKNESIVALHQLETMQDDLIKLFNDRFDEINKKIGGLRTNLDIKPKVEKPKPAPTPVESAEPETEKEEKKKPKKPSPPKKPEAEERIDQIRSEVEKVLERLGQMETEA
jgi:hypothetical protein